MQSRPASQSKYFGTGDTGGVTGRLSHHMASRLVGKRTGPNHLRADTTKRRLTASPLRLQPRSPRSVASRNPQENHCFSSGHSGPMRPSVKHPLNPRIANRQRGHTGAPRGSLCCRFPCLAEANAPSGSLRPPSGAGCTPYPATRRKTASWWSGSARPMREAQSGPGPSLRRRSRLRRCPSAMISGPCPVRARGQDFGHKVSTTAPAAAARALGDE